jgi:hypothetical protein
MPQHSRLPNAHDNLRRLSEAKLPQVHRVVGRRSLNPGAADRSSRTFLDTKPRRSNEARARSLKVQVLSSMSETPSPFANSTTWLRRLRPTPRRRYRG